MRRARWTVGFAVGVAVGLAPHLVSHRPTSQPHVFHIAPAKHPVLQHEDNA